MMKKYRCERKGRRSFDTTIPDNTVSPIASEETRTAKSAVRAPPKWLASPASPHTSLITLIIWPHA